MSRDIPTTTRELDETSLLGLGAVTVGDELWLPVSPIRSDGRTFRAVKVTVEERASVGGYEEKNAIDRWEDTSKTTIIGPAESHQTAEGYHE